MANAKTLRKRIALVAAAAVGVGVLAAAPAFALAMTTAQTLTITAPVTASAGTTSVPIPQGTAITANLTLTTGTTALASGDTIVTTYVVTNPLSTVITGAVTAAAGPIGTNGTLTGGTTGAITVTATGAVANAAYVIGTLNLTAAQTAVPGTWTVTTTTVVTSAGNTNTPTELAANIFVSGAGITQGTTRGQTGTATTGNASAVTFFTATHPASTLYKIISSGVGSIASVVQGVGTATSIVGIAGAGNWSNGANYTTAAATTTESAVVALTSTVAGAQTITVSTVDAITGLLTTVSTATVTWGASPAFSASNSTAFIGTTTTVATADAASVTASKAAVTVGTTNQAATISVVVKNNAATPALLAGETITATLSGPGILSGVVLIGDAVAATGKVVTAVTPANGAVFFRVYADGTSGTSTITITDGGVVIGTAKTVSFYGAIATLAATQVKTVYAIGANAASITVLAKDSNGTVVPGATVYGSSATTATGATTTASAVTDTTGTATFGFTGSASGSTVLTFGDLATAPTVSTTTTVKVALSTGTTVTLAFDKASYAPGDKAVLTLTVKDANGSPVADATYTGLFTADLTSTTSLGGAGLGGSISPALVNGVKTWTLYAPLAAGPFSVNGTTGTAGLVTAAQSVAFSASATVKAAVVDTTAVDAATAAAKAASAAVAALSVTVAALIASVTAQLRALTIIVKKIQAKLKIK